ncbi:MAG: alpha/beta hydrolase fold domain-containing protein, partial [Pseudonocardia sp.]|nr:alpha/beta hydrolase fold domain-containing protein [Pseudonocardia sp.]
DEGGPAIALQVLIYPATEHNVDTPSAIQNAEGYLLQRASMRWYWGHYLDGATDTPDWRASPLRAASHADLPPAFIATAEFDPLRDDGRLYADKLRNDGVKVTYNNYEGMIHGFYWMQGVVDRARDLHADIAREVRAVLHGS